MYWVDPNKGCKEDAIQVHCNFTVTEDETKITTCVYPEEKMSIEKDNWSSKLFTKAQKWFDEDHEFGKLVYSADNSQLTYLGYLSKAAFQNVTVHCKKSIAWFDNQNKNFKRALRFKGTEEQEFAYTPKDSNNDESRFMPEILKDECAYLSSGWKETVFKFNSNKFVRLPITDIAPISTTVQDSEFGVELGPVCFM